MNLSNSLNQSLANNSITNNNSNTNTLNNNNNSTNSNTVISTATTNTNITSSTVTNCLKLQPVTKDWCCPWCLNDCFCSRCVREEHMFKLTSLYLYHNGSLPDLKHYLIREDIILNNLQVHTIVFKTVIKDGLCLERVNKLNSKYRNRPEFEKDENNISNQEKSYISHFNSLTLVKNEEMEKINKINENFVDAYEKEFKIDMIIEEKILKKQETINSKQLEDKTAGTKKGILINKNKLALLEDENNNENNTKRPRGRPRKSISTEEKENSREKESLMKNNKKRSFIKLKNKKKRVTFNIRRKKVIDNKENKETISASSSEVNSLENEDTNETETGNKSKTLRKIRKEKNKYKYLTSSQRKKILINSKNLNKNKQKNKSPLEVIDLTGRIPESNYCSKDIYEEVLGKKHTCKYNLSNLKIKNKKKKLINQLKSHKGTEILVYPLEDFSKFKNTSNLVQELKCNLKCKCSKHINEENKLIFEYKNKNKNSFIREADVKVNDSENENENENSDREENSEDAVADNSNNNINNNNNFDNKRDNSLNLNRNQYSNERVYLAKFKDNFPNNKYTLNPNKYEDGFHINDYSINNDKLKISNKNIKIKNNKIYINSTNSFNNNNNNNNNLVDLTTKSNYNNSNLNENNNYFLNNNDSITENINKMNGIKNNNYNKANKDNEGKRPVKLLVKKRLKSKANMLNGKKF